MELVILVNVSLLTKTFCCTIWKWPSFHHSYFTLIQTYQPLNLSYSQFSLYKDIPTNTPTAASYCKKEYCRNPKNFPLTYVAILHSQEKNTMRCFQDVCLSTSSCSQCPHEIIFMNNEMVKLSIVLFSLFWFYLFYNRPANVTFFFHSYFSAKLLCTLNYFIIFSAKL